MRRISRLETINIIYENRLMPVFYHPDITICKQVIRACYQGGIRVFELTNRGDFAHELFATLRQYAFEQFPDLVMGIGSVVDAPTAALYMQSGANFIVSPILNPDMARVCNRRKILWIPGCGSVTEISLAEELGAEIIKVFPATQVGGPDFISAVRGPMPWSSLMPSGGVEPTAESLKAWFDAGVACVGMGSQLIPKSIIETGGYDLLTNKVSETLELIRHIRSKK